MNVRRRQVKRIFLRYLGTFSTRSPKIDKDLDLVWDNVGNCLAPVLISGRIGPRWWQKKKRKNVRL